MSRFDPRYAAEPARTASCTTWCTSSTPSPGRHVLRCANPVTAAFLAYFAKRLSTIGAKWPTFWTGLVTAAATTIAITCELFPFPIREPRLRVQARMQTQVLHRIVEGRQLLAEAKTPLYGPDRRT